MLQAGKSRQIKGLAPTALHNKKYSAIVNDLLTILCHIKDMNNHIQRKEAQHG